MENTLTQQNDIKGLIGCMSCEVKGLGKKAWITLGESFDLSSVGLARRTRVSHNGEQICIRCNDARFHCYNVKGFEHKGNVSVLAFQREAAKCLNIDEQIDRDALIALMRHDRITSFSDAIEQLKERFVTTWMHFGQSVLDFLFDYDLLFKCPPEIMPFINLEEYIDMLIEKNIIVLVHDAPKIWVFWP
jgi:hypothetical protein